MCMYIYIYMCIYNCHNTTTTTTTTTNNNNNTSSCVAARGITVWLL